MADVVVWFRRDLRLVDHAALEAGYQSAGGDRVLPLFVLDPRVWRAAPPIRRAWLQRSLRELSAASEGALVVRQGDPAHVVPKVAREIHAKEVHITADAGPYGRQRDIEVEDALGALSLVRTGSPYAVPPGTLRSGAGRPYRVFTPYFRAWLECVEVPVISRQPAVHWLRGVASDSISKESESAAVTLPPVGESAAFDRMTHFAATDLCEYHDQRDRPDLDATSGLSSHLKFGEIHPLTIMRAISRHHCSGAQAFRRQLAWRDFLADVTWHQPHTTHDYHRTEFASMSYDPPGESFRAWCEGRTGYPFIDAGMRQLQASGWMHNRLRMVVASFLVKDLHIEWTHGARHFMRSLHDGDLANNQHGWQWVAGCGVDAAPYFRIFNPILQGLKFDPDGDFVRRWIPELRHIPGSAVHQPWLSGALDHGEYPARIVDHAEERKEALRRLAELRAINAHREVAAAAPVRQTRD